MLTMALSCYDGARANGFLVARMATPSCGTHLVVLVAVVAYADLVLKPNTIEGEQGSGLGSGITTGLNVTTPSCTSEEFLTSNGTHLICRQLSPPTCVCPGVTVLGISLRPIVPLPPGSCRIFEPPTRGGFVCIRNPDIIYCSVYCDHRFEFSTSPRNPYFCGNSSGYQWMDFSGATHNELPRCTGFRHRSLLLHREEFYFPSPCYGLSNYTTLIIMSEFHDRLSKLGCTDCEVTDAFLHCPAVNGSVTYFAELHLGSDWYVRKKRANQQRLQNGI